MTKARYLMLGGFLGAGKTTAVAKLADAPNYSWTTTTEGGRARGPSDGKTEKAGYTSFSIAGMNGAADSAVIMKGEKAAIKLETTWQSQAELQKIGLADKTHKIVENQDAVNGRETFALPGNPLDEIVGDEVQQFVHALRVGTVVVGDFRRDFFAKIGLERVDTHLQQAQQLLLKPTLRVGVRKIDVAHAGLPAVALVDVAVRPFEQEAARGALGEQM